MTKWHNVITKVDGISFDSKKEARRYQELKLMQQARLIKDLILQPKFVLQEGFSYTNRSNIQFYGRERELTIRPIVYIADFQ